MKLVSNIMQRVTRASIRLIATSVVGNVQRSVNDTILLSFATHKANLHPSTAWSVRNHAEELGLTYDE